MEDFAMKRSLTALFVIMVSMMSAAMVLAQAPTITGRSPARNAVSASAASDVALTFSQTMNAGTASSSAIKIYGSQTGLRTFTGKGTFSGGGTNTITFNPTSNFKPGELVTVLATTNAKNSGGTSISSPSIYTYTAAASSAPATFADTTNFFTETCLLAR